jgi:hypothetical protein
MMPDCFFSQNTVEVASIVVSDGRHNGFFDLYISGPLIISREATEELSQFPVDGVETVLVLFTDSVIRVAVTPHWDGEPMSYQDIKTVSRHFKQAFTAWARA